MGKRADGSYSAAWRGVSKIVLRPLIRMLMKRDWHGQEHFPASGGVVIAVNHLSYADVLAVSLFTDQAGRYPVFLAKSTLFDIKVLGAIMRKLGQLPVYRNQTDAALVLKDAEQGVRNGACVIFYPEGTVTRDKGQWPMAARTGVARLALAAGAPVIPIAHWGAQDILPYGSLKPRVLPRRTVHMVAGPPVDLSEFAGLPLDAPTLRAATEKIMKDITALLATIRGETPPPEPFHPAIARRKLRQELRQLAAGQTTAERAGPAGDAAAADAVPGDTAAGEAAPGEAAAQAAADGRTAADGGASESAAGGAAARQAGADNRPGSAGPP
jgi:1-acyl-sn-glycerol-3-phosphate acyltransferase